MPVVNQECKRKILELRIVRSGKPFKPCDVAKQISHKPDTIQEAIDHLVENGILSKHQPKTGVMAGRSTASYAMVTPKCIHGPWTSSPRPMTAISPEWELAEYLQFQRRLSSHTDALRRAG